MSFESLVKKLMKEGKSKTAATKIAGSVANAKMKGAGSGPTAKQKARAKSPATKKPKPRAVIRDKDRVADKSRSYTDKKGRKIEIKTFKHEKAYDSGVKEDPNKPSMKRKSSRLSNTVELQKTKTKKDGTTKTKIKRAAGGTKKSQRLHTKFAKGKNKEGSSDVTITRKSPTTIKKSPSKMKSPAKKPLVGKQKSLPKELQEAILKSPGKMLTKSAIKMMDKSPMNMKTPMKKSKQKVEQDYARNAIADYKSGKTKEAKYEKKKALEVAAGESPAKMKMRKAKKAVKKGMTPDEASNKGLVKNKDYNKLLKSRAYKKQRADEAGYKSVRKAKEAAKANDGFLPESPAKMKKTQKRKKTYSSSKIDPNYHDQASKTVSTQKGRYSEGKTKTKFVNSDSPYHDKNYMNRESLTKTKTVNKGYGQSGRSITNETRKSISPERADRMRSRFRKGLEKQSPSMMKTNQDGGGYAAKNPAAPARQLKKLGSVLSKHFKSNM